MSEKKDNSSSILRGSSFALLGQVTNKVFRFILNIILTNTLTVTYYGLYVLTQSIFSIIMQVSLLGTHNSIVYFIPKLNEKTTIKSICLAICAISSLTISFFLFIFSEKLSSLFNVIELILIFKILAPFLPLYVLIFLIAYFFRSLNNIKYEVLLRDIFYPVVLLLTTFLFLFVKPTIESSIYALSTTIFFLFIFAVILLKRKRELTFSFKNLENKVTRILKYSLTVFPIGFSYILLNHLDRIIIGLLSSEQGVGFYNVASIFAALTIILLVSLSAPFSPLISELYSKGDKDNLSKAYSELTNVLMFLSFPIACLLVLFSSNILLLFGPDYMNAKLALIILVAGKSFSLFAGPAEYLLTMTGHPKYELANVMVMLVVNLVLNIILISYIGFVGAAVATSITVIFINLVRLVQVKNILSIRSIGIKQVKNFVLFLILLMISFLLKELEIILKVFSFLMIYIFYYFFFLKRIAGKGEKIYLYKIMREVIPK